MASIPESIAKYCGPHYYGGQDENGTDLSLIRENLQRLPEERLINGDRHAAGLRELMEHARRRNQKQASAIR